MNNFIELSEKVDTNIISSFTSPDKYDLYNISFVKFKDRIMWSGRKDKKGFNRSHSINSTIVGGFTDSNFKITNHEKINIKIDEDEGLEDPRMFVIKNRLFLALTKTKLGKYKISKMFNGFEKVYVCVAELDENFNIINFKEYHDYGINKNWTLFENKGDTYLINHFSPFIYYKFDVDTLDIYDRKEIFHKYKYLNREYRCARVFESIGSKIKCFCHVKCAKFLPYYVFQIFEIDLDEQSVVSKSDPLSFYDHKNIGIFTETRYPHHIQNIENKYILSENINNNQIIFHKIDMDMLLQ
jgi:hypothetical protein